MGGGEGLELGDLLAGRVYHHLSGDLEDIIVIISDIDGVISNFESAWRPFLANLAGEDKMKGVPTSWVPDIWDWDVRAYGTELVQSAWAKVRREPGFWLKLHPMPGAKEALIRLSHLQKHGHSVHFLTQREGFSAQFDTSKWLYDNGILYPSVLVVKDAKEKINILHDLGADFFVDDKLSTMEAWIQHTHLNRKFGYYALIDAPYNRDGRTVRGMHVAESLTEALKEAGLWNT